MIGKKGLVMEKEEEKEEQKVEQEELDHALSERPAADDRQNKQEFSIET